MNVVSVCSGIGAPEYAWLPLGFHSVAVSEIDPFPCWALAARFGASRPMFMPEPEPIMRELVFEPGDREALLEVRKRRAATRAVADLPETAAVPNWGDMTRFREWPDANVDVLVGGTPCQSFSVAGLREGLADPRGNLALTYLAIADRYRPEWLVWENVPGVLSSNGGRDFGAILGALGKLGYGFSYRVLDAQFYGVAQRRRRVFVVANARDWRRAAAVLFERESLSGDSAPRREAGERAARPTPAGSPGSGGYRNDADTADNLIAFGGNNQAGPIEVATARTAHGGPHGRLDFESETFVVSPPLMSDGKRRPGTVPDDAGSLIVTPFDTTQITSKANRSHPRPGAPSHPLAAGAHPPAIAYRTSGNCGAWETGDQVDTLTTGTDRASSVLSIDMAVRRLTVQECERLQGFPDGWTAIRYRGKPAADGPRYKAIGNSMAVPVMRWIGERIMWVESQR
jgi:DNA (cytosine-5)-methyltransferase 1